MRYLGYLANENSYTHPPISVITTLAATPGIRSLRHCVGTSPASYIWHQASESLWLAPHRPDRVAAYDFM
ncbi:hypothetical protein SCLCIDRAFT_649879 [Scleroderma citrinum Foug A]|uniref:Uncharacterized protein n=1 Tax=Scleroderma citrinum Foug A TaxID=1036808 RepID=A0A0C3D4L7_9AGAM|nr:hypothetical protein SCLCIDRAFT_649879 [Scleroderma citrinum Foug A]